MYNTTRLLKTMKERGIGISRPTLLKLMEKHPSCDKQSGTLIVDVSFIEEYINRLDVRKCVDLAKTHGVAFSKEDVRNIVKHHPKSITSPNGGKMYIYKQDFLEILKESKYYKEVE